MADREFWFQQTWSARMRHDGIFEPGVPIGAVGFSPNPDDLEETARVTRYLMKQFNKLPASEPFFLIQGKCTLVPPEATTGERQ